MSHKENNNIKNNSYYQAQILNVSTSHILDPTYFKYYSDIIFTLDSNTIHMLMLIN